MLLVQCLGLYASTAGGMVQSLVRERRSHMPHSQRNKAENNNKYTSKERLPLPLIFFSHMWLLLQSGDIGVCMRVWGGGRRCHFLSPYYVQQFAHYHISAAAAKSRQLCPTLWDPIDGSPPGSPVPGILQSRTLEWVAITFLPLTKWFRDYKETVAERGLKNLLKWEEELKSWHRSLLFLVSRAWLRYMFFHIF